MSPKSMKAIPFHCGMATLTLLLSTTTVAAADLEMVDGYGNIAGVIDASRKGLMVTENSGNRFFYRRARRYDLPDGRYLGFYNETLNRIIRFPRSGRGPVERADLDSIYPQFVPASVRVRPIGSGPGFAPYLPTWLETSYQFTAPGYRFYSGTISGGPGYGGFRYGGPGYGSWPALGGYYRSGVSFSVASPLAVPAAPMMPTLAPAQPQSTLIESRVVDNGTLDPVEVEFVNSQNETLLVVLTDARTPGKKAQYQIQPGGSQRVKLPRSAGQTRIDRYQSWDIAGDPVEREVRVAMEPEARYQVAVDRTRIQSIAIDRTGKSPNVIEDINMQSVPVGVFTLPPGDQLVSGKIDLFDAATR
ncbi:hypothetical protein [Allorhodopirellula solitaria]|uniref:SLA1 homology domain-containing protein n=1 Tax=Allorhodopirellula solitaria TaxID=2527987 RepID=A0A5C5XP25_9BACT|nr:hypothetical protein [Allorhodopirellula solitaria]TWT64670.1 hypothetical protein CA85_38030 [Allorhodopirellula solitaria]